jgi:hypothetical protein
MGQRVEDIDREIKRLDDICAAMKASSPQGNDRVIWRSLERDVENCTEKLVKLLAQAAIQNDQETSRLLMERLDRVDALARSIRQRDASGKTG